MKRSANEMEIPREFAKGELMHEEDLQHYFAECGKNVKVYKGCRIFPPSYVKIGSHSQIDEGAVIFSGSRTRIGSYVHVGFHSSIFGGGECDIGDFVSISPGVRIITGTDIPANDGLNNPTVPSHYRKVHRSKVCIRSYAIIFTNTIIFPGVTIGEGAVVSAGSLVRKDLQPWIIYAGNPLVAVRKREKSEIIRQANECMKSNDGSNFI